MPRTTLEATEMQPGFKRLGMVGLGRMGSALLKGWLRAGWQPDHWVVCDRQHNLEEAWPGVHVVPTAAEVCAAADVVVWCLKPHAVLDMVAGLPDPAHERASVHVSVAAGVSQQAWNQRSSGRPMVRAMPNTAVACQEGVVALHTEDAAWRESLTALFEPLGHVVWLAEEHLMHAVTAMSGSGTAYGLRWLAWWQAAGEAAGLTPEQSRTLARATMQGALSSAEAYDGPLDTLVNNVVSPGGTTEAALRVLDHADVGATLRRAVEAAVQRSTTMAYVLEAEATESPA